MFIEDILILIAVYFSIHIYILIMSTLSSVLFVRFSQLHFFQLWIAPKKLNSYGQYRYQV